MSDAPLSLLEDDLRHTYRAITERTTYSTRPAIESVDAPVPTPVRSRRRPVAALVGVAIVIALVLGAIAFVERDDSSTPRPAEPPVDTGLIFPPVQTHVGPKLYLVPAGVPAGYSLVRASAQASMGVASSGEGGTFQNWLKLDHDGRPVGVFQISWRPTEDVMLGPTEPLDVNGHPGFWASSLESVVWDQDGQRVFVSAFGDGPLGTWPERLSRAEVESVARSLVRDGSSRFALRSPPEGYRLAAEAPSTITQERGPVLLVYSDGADHGFSVQLVDDTDSPPGLALTHPQARLVEVRGARAVSSPFLNGGDGTGCARTDFFRCDSLQPDAEPGAHRYLQWLEPDGTRVTITAVGMGDDAVFAIADSLRDASQAEFEHLVATAPVIW